MAKSIVLTNITASSTIKVNGRTVYTLNDADAGAKKVTVADVGTFEWDDSGNATFKADAALSGEITLEITEGASLKEVDFSKAAGITYTGGANVASITGGAGNDYVKIDNTTTVAASVTLGAGADTLEFADTATKNVTLADYNYYQGDVIKAKGDVAVSDSGELTAKNAGGSVSVTAANIAVEDNWYAAKVDNAGTVVDYFTAVSGNNQNVTKDLSNSAIANVINAKGAKTANITLGKANDAVSLATVGKGVDTIKVGKASGNNTINDFGAEDVVAIDGIKLVTLGLAAGSNTVKASYGSTGLTFAGTGVGAATAKGSLNLNDGSQTHKLAYAFSDSATLNYTTYSDADWVLGAENKSTTLEVGATTHLHDISKYKNITKITVADGLKLDAPISLTGAINKDNEINAQNAKVGVAVWGFSSGSDAITLGAGKDTVWFGAGDGTDSIIGFKYGTASDSDVLYLKDTKALKAVNVAYDTSDNKAKFTVGSAVATVDKNGVTDSSDVAQIQLADEKTYKVAGEYTEEDAVTINTDDIDGLDYYAFAGNANKKTVKVKGGKDWIVHSLYTDFYTTNATIGTIDATNATGNVTLAAAATIKGGKGTSNIWTYQSDAAASVNAGDGTDIIWFAENADQAVSVSGFAAGTDVVKFATAQSLKDIAEGYKFTDNGNNTTIEGAKNSSSALALNNVKAATINLVDANDKAYKASLHNNTAGLSFSTDVNIYGGGATILSADGSVDGTVSLRLGKESRGLSSDTYYIDDAVTEFNGSKSTATFWIAGNANESNTITGGMTENYLYGGGASADTLVGSIVAKDTFYFGTGDGVDVVTGGIDKEDTIALWNVEDADIANVKVTVNEAGTATISLSDTSTLTISDSNAAAAIGNGLTFTSASQTAYTYDSESKTLVKKA